MESFNEEVVEFSFERIFGISNQKLEHIFREKRKMMYIGDDLHCYIDFSQIKQMIKTEVEENFMEELCPILNKKTLIKELYYNSYELTFIDYIMELYYNKIFGVSYELVKKIYEKKNKLLLDEEGNLRNQIDYDNIYNFIEEEVNANFA